MFTFLYFISYIFRSLLNIIILINVIYKNINYNQTQIGLKTINNIIKNLLIKSSIFLFFYFILNLYIMPTYADCFSGAIPWRDVDLNLLDLENNTYKGQEIVYQDKKFIITRDIAESNTFQLQVVFGTLLVMSSIWWIYLFFFCEE